jgi:hypothetical protein
MVSVGEEPIFSCSIIAPSMANAKTKLAWLALEGTRYHTLCHAFC